MILSGRHAFVWPKAGWHKLDLPAVAADCLALGFRGVILHEGLAIAQGAVGRAAPFLAAGLEVSLGIGFPKPRPDNLRAIAAGILAALQVPSVEAVVLDWEGAWDGHEDDARWVVDAVLTREPHAAERTVDVPWWAPETLPNGHATHPHAPTREFGKLVSRRFPQCYGAPVDGRTTRMLAWARKQYPPLGAWPIAPCVQAYKRTEFDHRRTFEAEPDVLVWDWAELDEPCTRALKALAP